MLSSATATHPTTQQPKKERPANVPMTMNDIALLGQFAPILNALIQPSLEQAGLLLADHIRGWRLRNLASVVEKADRKLRERGLSGDQINPIKLAVGLPIVEKASVQEDEVLQDLWANLIVSSVADGQEIDPSYVEILHQFTRLDCEVLELVVHNGFDTIAKDGDFMLVVPIKVEDVESKWNGARLSVEKLSSLGCMELQMSTDPKNSKRLVLPTLFGASLYVMSSGKRPVTLEGVKDVGSLRMF